MFKPKRLDGRSTTNVVIDLIKDANPGDVFEYDAIIHALNAGSSSDYSVVDARNAVIRSKSRLSRDYQRAVRNIPGLGYKIAAASEHREIAIKHKKISERQLSKGIQVLKGVKWNEMDQQSRMAHEGTLMIMSEMHERQQWIERRVKKIEAIISNINKPV